ncbi:MAG: hypothetical protein E7675_08425 [Ruminococcaceae bacterium]|nr:hypothetical protein [Oscillospiraceae bacterium]
MNFPKLKNALICRITPYVLVLGAFILPIIAVIALPFIPESVKPYLVIGLVGALIVYLSKNFAVLMMMDITLATLHCHNSARKRYDLPGGRNSESIEKSLNSFGKPYDPIAVLPKPSALRYKFSSSATVYAKGIERVIALYKTDYLDKEEYNEIQRSAKANSLSLKGKKKQRILDSQQKKAPIHRVTVFVIIAKNVEEKLYENLYDKVSKNGGDDDEDSYIPCVINLNNRTCVFNSLSSPYVGFGYPVKNRGIKFVKKYVFGGNMPKSNRHMMDPIKDIDREMSIWSFWSNMKKEIIDNDKKAKKRYETMDHGEIVVDDDCLYVKWNDKGTCILLEFDKEAKKVTVYPAYTWDYPKSNPIAKKTSKEINGLVEEYFKSQGFKCEFITFDE